MKNYSYLIVDNFSGEAAVIDPAWEMEKILQHVDRLDINLSTILLTHHHHDHVNLVGPLVKRFNADVYMHAREIDTYGFRSQNLVSVENFDQIPVGNTVVDCIHTPGHTAGGMCYLLPDRLFTGDTVFIEGCGMCTGRGGNPEEMYYSIDRIKRTLDPRLRIYPGHSYGKEPGCKLGHLFEQNIYFQLEKDRFIAFRMRKNQKNLFRFH